MTQTVKLADYLFTRLRQLDVQSIHGVPGDYNLTLLDHVEPAGLLWVGSTNELNAGYAADGYARVKGIGALITTFGVGELSAINAIAGAFAERAAVVHIVGTPPRSTQDARLMVHHTLGDGDYQHFAQMYTHVTVAQTNLVCAQTAAQQIDMVLKQCLLHSRPVYIQVPMDMVDVELDAKPLDETLIVPKPVLGSGPQDLMKTLLERMYNAKRPIILVDSGTRTLGITSQVSDLVASTKWPTFSTTSGQGLVNASLPNVHGIYRGSYADSKMRAIFEDADLILCFGPHFSSTNSYFWSALPKEAVTISFSHDGIKIGSSLTRDIVVKTVVENMLQLLDSSRIAACPTLNGTWNGNPIEVSKFDSSDTIRHDKLWQLMSRFLRPGDIVLGETGTAAYGLREMSLPENTTVFAPITWLSIGYMLPAAQGAALAQRELIKINKQNSTTRGRTILIIGDGSFQMTAQELATIVRHQLDVIVFVINNDGYTIERCIHGRYQSYNDVSAWRYLLAPAFFGAAKNSYTASAKTYGDLSQVLQDSRLSDGDGLRMVEIYLDREDAPVGPLLDLLHAQNKLSGEKK